LQKCDGANCLEDVQKGSLGMGVAPELPMAPSSPPISTQLARTPPTSRATGPRLMHASLQYQAKYLSTITTSSSSSSHHRSIGGFLLPISVGLLIANLDPRQCLLVGVACLAGHAPMVAGTLTRSSQVDALKVALPLLDVQRTGPDNLDRREELLRSRKLTGLNRPSHLLDPGSLLNRIRSTPLPANPPCEMAVASAFSWEFVDESSRKRLWCGG
jgi:hypothetical protein